MAIQGEYYAPQTRAAAPGQQYYTPPLPVGQADFQVQGQNPSQWATGICYSCFHSCEDFNICCLTCWCSCITFGRIAEIVNRGSSSCCSSCMIYCCLCHFTGCEWIYTGMNRSTLRTQYNLPGTPCSDLLLHYFCHKCALRQEYRELRHRGFDMTIGWNANVQRMQRQFAAVGGEMVPPIAYGGMTR